MEILHDYANDQNTIRKFICSYITRSFIIIIINTLFEIGKKLHSSAKNLQSNLYQLKIIIIMK